MLAQAAVGCEGRRKDSQLLNKILILSTFLLTKMTYRGIILLKNRGFLLAFSVCEEGF